MMGGRDIGGRGLATPEGEPGFEAPVDRKERGIHMCNGFCGMGEGRRYLLEYKEDRKGTKRTAKKRKYNKSSGRAVSGSCEYCL